MTVTNDELLKLSIEAAKLGGGILKEGFGTLFEISSKEGRNNLVTEYDIKSEKAIIDLIKSRFPEHKILAEESGQSSDSDSQYTWIIDPLDGTVNFAHNIPIFSVSIACEKNGEIICGAVYHPLLDEMFYAQKYGGAFLNDKRIFVSQNNNLDIAVLVTGFPYNAYENPLGCIDTFKSMILRGIPVRRLGSAALDLVYVAAGRFDGFWETELKPWDVAAGKLIVQEAGGLVTNYQNKEFSIYDNTILATNGKIHISTLEVINRS